MAKRKRVLSGIQPTGLMHIGNFYGAVENWVRMQDEHECFICIVDYHALTVPKPGELPERVFDMACSLLGAGLDPERCTLFVQSDVPEHTELAWVLQTVAPLGELERMTQFKEKSRANVNVNAGLFTYPVLQAADILVYKADLVPVGEDQLQHLELTREVARRFNNLYGEVFPEPQAQVGRGARVMGIDGESKMSKSLGNQIDLIEPPESIWEKIRPAPTDPRRVRRSDPGEPEDCNIFSYHGLFTGEAERRELAHGCRTAGIGCVDCKKVLLASMDAALTPIRERTLALRQDRERVAEILAAGAARARAEARATMDETRRAVGVGSELWRREPAEPREREKAQTGSS